jgi:hypothetical protein
LKAHAAFAYRNKAGRREYVRANMRSGPDGALEARSFREKVAGLLSLLIETGGLVELPESMTQVETRGDGRVSAQGVATCHVKPTLTLVRGLDAKQGSRRKRTSRPRHASNLAGALNEDGR